MRLKFLGVTLLRYSGFDPGRNHLQLVAGKGQVVDVSDEKAEKLLVDFPKDWVKEGQEPLMEPELKHESTVGMPVEEPTGKVPKKNKAIVAPKKAKRR